MKRVCFIIITVLILVALATVVTASAEGNPCWVKVSSCTLRERPQDETSGNSLAKLKNGYTMLIVGDDNGYYVVDAASIADEEGLNLGLSGYGYIKHGHVKLGNKQYVVLRSYTLLYDDIAEGDDHEIAEKSAGTKLNLLSGVYRYDGQLWYKVQLPGTAGIAFVRGDLGSIEDAIQPMVVQQQPVQQPQQQAQQQEQQPQQQAQQQPQTQQVQPQVQPEDVSYEELELEAGGTAIVAIKKLSVRSAADDNAGIIGYLQKDDEVEILEFDGRYAVIKFRLNNGQEVRGYVPYVYLLPGAVG